ncbi:MAG: hypothetical protein JKX80_01225 [Candidatus Pacebacteria bacterium]|nr:hypothetical protein [Candidatus Paceibacterota bacterium]
MSFLFEEKTSKIMKWVGGFFAVIIIISMLLLYAPGLLSGSGGALPSHSAPVS